MAQKKRINQVTHIFRHLFTVFKDINYTVFLKCPTESHKVAKV